MNTLISLTHAQPDDERGKILRIALELKTAIRPHLIRLERSELSGPLTQTAVGTARYLSEIVPDLYDSGREAFLNSTIDHMADIATMLDLFRSRNMLTEQEFHRLRILAIRCTHLLSRLAGLSGTMHPSLLALRMAS